MKANNSTNVLKSFNDLSVIQENYKGSLTNFQTKGSSYKNKKYQRMSYEKDPYNTHQNHLYKRALYGLKAYTKEEVAKLHPQKAKRITKVNKRAQFVLNLYKQTLTNKAANAIFEILFPKSKLAKNLKNDENTLKSFQNTISLKDLGITKEMVIDLFIKEKVLPQNFYNL